MKYIFLILILTISSLNAQNNTKVITLTYEINKSHLTTAHQNILNDFLKINKVLKAEITGYTDYLGTKEKNLTLSQNRSNKAKVFLEGKGVKVASSTGKGITGKTLTSSKGISKNRRIEVVFYFTQNEIAVKEKEPNPLQEEILKLKVGDKLVLKNFNFIPGRHFLVAKSKPELSKLIDIMEANKTLKIELHGHICCEIVKADGWDIDNLNYSLSTNRAQYIYQQLIKFGISADRISYKGFGRKKPLFPNELTDEEKNANRRVEILIVEK